VILHDEMCEGDPFCLCHARAYYAMINEMEATAADLKARKLGDPLADKINRWAKILRSES
jgi:hypothetical protein